MNSGFVVNFGWCSALRLVERWAAECGVQCDEVGDVASAVIFEELR
jgi:hypothetical protein